MNARGNVHHWHQSYNTRMLNPTPYTLSLARVVEHLDERTVRGGVGPARYCAGGGRGGRCGREPRGYIALAGFEEVSWVSGALGEVR